MRLMITGAGGFLGSRLVSYYQEKQDVRGVLHTEVDFTDVQQAMEVVCSYRPDVVLHCGAISDVGTCSKKPSLSYQVNVQGTQNLAAACRHVGARFVFCSSDQVYFRTWRRESGESREAFLMPHQEKEKAEPIPVYGQHKLLAEEICRQVQPDSVILRLTWMYDELTQEEQNKGRRNLAVMLEDSLQTDTKSGQGEGLPAFSETDYRGVTDVREVVKNMEAAWQLPAGVYNFGSAGSTNMYDTVCRVMKALGREELVKKAPLGELRNLTMNTAKAEAQGIRFSDTAQGLERWLQAGNGCRRLPGGKEK